MGNTTEFKRVAKLLEETLTFDSDINVSVFETNIRSKSPYQLKLVPVYQRAIRFLTQSQWRLYWI